MKIDKNEEKRLKQLIKEQAMNYGFQLSSNSIYKSDEKCFYCANYVIVEKRKLVYRIGVKKKIYDDLFWIIMDMMDNLEKDESVRAKGAFVAPLIELDHGTIEFEGDIEDVVSVIIKTIVREIESSMSIIGDVNYYVLHDMKQLYGADVLRSLALIDNGNVDLAKTIAEEHRGKSGFVNEGRDFFARLIDYYQK